MLNSTLLHITILFGAIQGFTLCLYVYHKRKINLNTFFFFLLFLFSLAYFNLKHALLFMRVKDAWFTPILSFPYPYKFLLGVGLYFYVKNHFPRLNQKGYHKKEWYLFIPAIISEIWAICLYFIKSTGFNENIYIDVYQTGFYHYYETAYLLFNLLLGVIALKFIIRNQEKIITTGKSLQDLKWLKLFLQTFLVYTLINFSNQIIFLLFNLHEIVTMYACVLIVNSLYIYWIGFIGYAKSQILFKSFQLKTKSTERVKILNQKLLHSMEVEELFKNSNIKIADFALKLDLNVKELSSFINEHYKMNFSEYINHYRVEEVKKLLLSPRAEKYTLLTIANESGFSSKSSFNAIFKKMTGLTPKEYKQQTSGKKV